MRISHRLPALYLAFTASLAMAEPADVLKVDDDLSIAFDAVGETLMYVDYSRVETHSKTGRIKYTMHGRLDDDAVLPDRTLKFTTGYHGYVCVHDAPYFSYVVTPSGKASLKCQSWPFGVED